MIWTIVNPTHRPKAVRSAGGLVVVAPGQTRSFEEDWDQYTRLRYAAAGLQLSSSAAEPAPEPGAEESPVTTSSSSRADRLRDIVAEFPEDDDDYWMTDGRPQVNMLNAALESGEQRFTARERDSIWAEIV